MAKNRICSIAGCFKPHDAKGFCKKHYYRWSKYGTFDPLPQTKLQQAVAFVNDALTSGTDDCILWPTHLRMSDNGYGRVPHDGRTVGAHRLVCILAHGPEPFAKADAAHRCGVRRCVNPRHVRWATRTENHLDTVLHGTNPRGERHGRAKLTEADVLEMRRMRRVSGATHDEIGRQFGVSTSTAHNAITGRRWGYLEGAA
jgi:hypothetical protein